MKKIFLIISLVFLFSSCCTPRRCPYLGHTDSTSTEKIVIKEYHDSIVSVVLKDSIVEVMVSMPDTSHLETDVAVSEAWTDTLGYLHHSLSNKLTPLEVTLEVPTITTLEKKYLTRTVIKEVEKDLSPWKGFLLVMGRIFFCVCILAVAYLIFRIIRKFSIFAS